MLSIGALILGVMKIILIKVIKEKK